MSINRQNYEEYFILYMDNELGSQERRMVEAFVELHPDLKEELDLIMQFKLAPDTNIIFEGKEELMAPETSGILETGAINISNYQEWLSLSVDQELKPEQSSSFEQFLAANPTVKKELAIWQRAKLQPETIIFADKAALYRTTEKVKPFPVRWWRLAAAAVLLIGVSITTVILVNKKSPAEKELVKTVTPGKKTTPVNQPQQPNSPVNETLLADNNNLATSPVKQTEQNNTIARGKNNPAKKEPVINTNTAVKIKDEVVANTKPTNDLPKPLNNPNINKPDAATDAIASIDPKETNKQKDALTNTIVTTQNPQSSDIVYASSTDVADLDQPDSKKNKNRGLFRKIARTFEKRTNIDATDDDRLLIAGLSIKLK